MPISGLRLTNAAPFYASSWCGALCGFGLARIKKETLMPLNFQTLRTRNGNWNLILILIKKKKSKQKKKKTKNLKLQIEIQSEFWTLRDFKAESVSWCWIWCCLWLEILADYDKERPGLKPWSLWWGQIWLSYKIYYLGLNKARNQQLARH